MPYNILFVNVGPRLSTMALVVINSIGIAVVAVSDERVKSFVENENIPLCLIKCYYSLNHETIVEVD